MKKLLILIVTVTFATFLIAAPVPEATILLVAENWLEMYTGADCTIDSYRVINNEVDEALIYRIDFLPDGYVLIAADDSSLPILAYSDKGSILDTANPGREDLISQYAYEISGIKANNLANTYTLPIWSSISSKAATSVSTHLIDLGTDWSQGSPYNNYCPYDDHNSGRSVVGCTATATSQIINYHKYWDYTLSSTDGYTSTKNGFTTIIDDSSTEHNFPNFTTLNSYMNNVATKYQNHQSLDTNEIAALCFATGILSKTKYSSSASGAYSTDAQATYEKLNYNSQLLERYNFTSGAWQDTILCNLNADRPVQYVGRTAPQEGRGHVFILHGYRTVGGVTQFKINWGWGAGYNSGYYTLTELNVDGTNNSYNYAHQMYHGVRPRVVLNQAVELDGGTGSPSQICVDARRSGGSTTTYYADSNGVFNVDLADEGSYKFTFYHVSGAYIPLVTGWIPMHKGSNSILPTSIVLEQRPTLVHVPTQAPTIQEGIDRVADGGTVIVASGTYYEGGLSWSNKHVRLIGAGNSVITSTSSNAIMLDWSGINNTDLIQGFTFADCHGSFGPAIILLEGASPVVSNCTFSDNMVEGSYDMNFNTPYGYGGAVFIQGGSNQVNSPRFENCTFTDNAAANGNGGGAVGLFGPATFLSCTFTNNWTCGAVGFGPQAYYAGGAILIYGNDYNGDILIHNCTFTGNYGQNEANDIWVAGSRGINNLTIDHCTFNPRSPSNPFYEPVIRIFYENMPYQEYSATNFVLTRNKFNVSDRGAVYFHDYTGRCSMQFNNNVINGIEGTTYGLKLHYYGGSPQNPDYFQFNNNTLLNLTSSGLILFKASHYTIENNVFHNCSPYDVRWGDHEGIPDHATESLTIQNCFFNDLTNHVDTQGNTYQEFSIYNPVVAPNPQLDSYHQPIWNASTMSPCIDSGVGIDEDGTPADIGAYTTVSHAHEVYTMPTNGTPKWMSFPVLNRTTPSYDIANNFFAPIASNDILDQVIWKEGNNESESMYYQGSTLVNGSHHVQSVLGYKIHLKSEVTQAIEIPVSGYIQNPNTIINLYAHPAGSSTRVNENWIGYFLPQSSDPFTALASILDKVTSIRTQYWSAIKGKDVWLISTGNLTLNYGDMVIITVSEDCSFAWGNEHPVNPKVRAKATAFEYVEKLDYTPMFIDLSSLEVLPSEIGLYVDGECKGAVKVEGSYTDLCAYLDEYEVINPEDFELVLYYDTKAAENVKQRCRLDFNNVKLSSEFGIRYFEISLNERTGLNPITYKNALSPNYPNPFNPETTISYEIATDGFVRLDIFNLKGQIVKTLVNENKVSGPHRVVWKGTDKYGRKVASGIYQYRLTTKEGSITRKMMLMK